MGVWLFDRRKFLIRPRFQLLLASKTAGFLLLYSAAIIYASLYSVAETIYILPFDCLTPEVKARLWRFPVEAMLLSVLIALVVVLHSIVITHRVAGPEYRLARIVRGMATGQYPNAVTLRKHDNLKELAAAVSSLSQALDQRRKVWLESLDQMDAALSTCANDISRHAPTELVHAQFGGLKKHICSLREVAEQASEQANRVDQGLPAPARSSPVSMGTAKPGSGDVPV